MASAALISARTTVEQAITLNASDLAARRADLASAPDRTTRDAARIERDAAAGIRTALTNAITRLEALA